MALTCKQLTAKRANSAKKRKEQVRSCAAKFLKIAKLRPLPLELEFELFAILGPLMLNADSRTGRNGKPFTSDLNGEGLLLFQRIG